MSTPAGGNLVGDATINVDADTRPAIRALQRFARAATTAGLGVGALSASAGSAAPLLAGIVTTLENVAPAGAVAVTGMLAVTQASAAIQLGMIGVEDAVTAAFDTSEKGAEKFAEALEKLSPSARAFAEQVREVRGVRGSPKGV